MERNTISFRQKLQKKIITREQCSYDRKDERDKGNIILSCALWVCQGNWDLFFIFSVSFSNDLKLKETKLKSKEFNFRKKHSRTFRFHFGFSPLICNAPHGRERKDYVFHWDIGSWSYQNFY